MSGWGDELGSSVWASNSPEEPARPTTSRLDSASSGLQLPPAVSAGLRLAPAATRPLDDDAWGDGSDLDTPSALQFDRVQLADPPDDDFGDDDGFGEPAAAGAGADDDDFGDFDDAPAEADDWTAAPAPVSFDSPSASLRLDRTSASAAETAEHIQAVFARIFPHAHASLSDEPERQIDGEGPFAAA